MVRKVPQSLAIVVDDDLPGLESEVGASVGLHARITTQGKLSRITVLADDIKRLAVFVLCVGIDYEASRKSATDGELEVRWDCLVAANSIDGPKAVFELTGVKVAS